MRALALTSLALAAAGCNSILGIGDVHSGASVDAPTATVDGTPIACPKATSGQIVGCDVVTHLYPDGSTHDVPQDLSNVTIRAFVVSGSTLGAPVDATSLGTGAFSIAVADGATYYLEFLDKSGANAVPTYFVTDQRNLDLGFVTIGRTDAVAVTKTTPVTLDFTGMTGWQPGDYLLVDSFADGTENFVNPTSNAPNIGDTTTNAQFDWDASYTFGADAAKLVDGAAGDDFWLTHNTSKIVTDAAGYPWTDQWIADSYTTTAVTMSDGTPVTVPAAATAFTKLDTSKHSETFSIDVVGSRAAIPDGGRYANEEWSCGVLTNYATSYHIFIGPSLVGFDQRVVPIGEDQIALPAIGWANPYPSAWPTEMVCTLRHARRLMMPSAAAPAYVNSYYGQIQPVTSPYALSPPFQSGHGGANIKIGGIAALNGGAVSFDGTAPVTMSWDPIPNSDEFTVGVFHGGIDLGNSTYTPIAYLNTSGSSVLLPADLFKPGDMYMFQVTEVSRSPQLYAAGHLRRDSTPQTWGRSMTGFMRFSSKCGDHNVDSALGEDCDTGGESGTCDADCSTVLCGDGYINAAAAEQCDEIDDTPTCNAGTCKLSTCGDGYLNRTAGEQCDDGNPNDGDGCNHLCQLEHCGDGVINTFEDCDDDNHLDGDGCSAFCRVEPGWSCTGAPSVCTRM